MLTLTLTLTLTLLSSSMRRRPSETAPYLATLSVVARSRPSSGCLVQFQDFSSGIYIPSTAYIQVNRLRVSTQYLLSAGAASPLRGLYFKTEPGETNNIRVYSSVFISLSLAGWPDFLGNKQVHTRPLAWPCRTHKGADASTLLKSRHQNHQLHVPKTDEQRKRGNKSNSRNRKALGLAAKRQAFKAQSKEMKRKEKKKKKKNKKTKKNKKECRKKK